MNRAEKEQVVEELKERVVSSKALVVTDYRGLNVEQMTELRRKLRQAGVEYSVVKNTLACFALRDAGYDELEQYFVGPSAIAFGVEDPVAPARELMDFSKSNKALEIKGGLVGGSVIGTDRVVALAKIPSRQELLTMIACGMKSPITGLVRTLQAPMSKMVQVLSAIKEQKENEE